MTRTPASLRPSLAWADVMPTVRMGLWVVLLFVAALWLVQAYSAPIQHALQNHSRLAIVLFVATSVVAVLVPMLTNLPLVPLAVLAWGPWWTALMLLTGWVAGAALSFLLARRARMWVLRCFPSATRHADIDRLIHPQHRLTSLILLRMSFPVDVLSYALGLFSRHTTVAENALTTALGAAPFALLFSHFPTLSPKFQVIVFVTSVLVFVAYTMWVLRTTTRSSL